MYDRLSCKELSMTEYCISIANIIEYYFKRSMMQINLV